MSYLKTKEGMKHLEDITKLYNQILIDSVQHYVAVANYSMSRAIGKTLTEHTLTLSLGVELGAAFVMSLKDGDTLPPDKIVQDPAYKKLANLIAEQVKEKIHVINKPRAAKRNGREGDSIYKPNSERPWSFR